MNDPDELTPEEIQAKANSAKISRFIGNIGWQGIIFAIVVYSTVYDNEIANWMLDVFTWMLAFAFISYFLTVAKSAEKLATENLSKLSQILTPTATALRGIGMVFSVVEISILFSYGYLYLAIFWGLTEILQTLSVHNVKKAVALQEGSLTTLASLAMDQDDKFAAKITPKLQEFNDKITELDSLMAILSPKGVILVEGDADYEAWKALNEERSLCFEAIEQEITRAALETIKKD